MFWQRSAPTRRLVSLAGRHNGRGFQNANLKTPRHYLSMSKFRSGAESNCGLGNPFYSAPSNHGTPEPRSIVADATVERWWEEINVYQEV